MAVKVLDSWALIAFFEDEPAAEDVERLLQQAADGRHKLLLCAVNWGEVYYNTMREVSEEAAEKKAREIALLPLEIVGVGDDLQLVREAAKLKAKHNLSYADCFAAALAKLRRAELVTGDPEFKQVQHDVKIAWLNQ